MISKKTQNERNKKKKNCLKKDIDRQRQII